MGLRETYNALQPKFDQRTPQQVTVKALEWEWPTEYGLVCQAKTSIGTYSISVDEDSAGGRMFCFLHLTDDADCTRWAIEIVSDYLEPEEVQAVAQADYERRILSALDQRPVTDTHPDDQAVDRFADAMKAKLQHAREHKGRSGWDDPYQCATSYLVELLYEHLPKGNDGTFEDIANFCMMLHQRGANPQELAEGVALLQRPVTVAEAARVLLDTFTSEDCETDFKPAWDAFCKALRYDKTIYQGMSDWLRAMAEGGDTE